MTEALPNQRRTLSKGLAALDTMAAIWAANINLREAAAHLAASPDSTRAQRIAAFCCQSYVEGAYQHYLDRDPAASRSAPSTQDASQGQVERAAATALAIRRLLTGAGYPDDTPAVEAVRSLIAMRSSAERAGPPDYKARFEAMAYGYGEIGVALGIPDDEVACANGPDVILEYIEKLKDVAPQPSTKALTDLIRERLARFAECADDDEDCDIGREWFDTLTTLGLLRRGRVRAVWYMTDEGKAMLAAEQPSEDKREYPPVITPALQEVLSLMLWDTGPIAHILRAGGVTIQPKAEEEQAHVLHWLIGLALHHGEAWRVRAIEHLRQLDADRGGRGQ